MTDLVKQLLESHSSAFNGAVEALFNSLFEATGPVSVNSHDAVEMLQNKVGENVNKTNDGTQIVGLAAQAGMGDEPLPNEMDQIVNSINNDMAKNVDLPDLPTEENLPNLSDNGGPDAMGDGMGDELGDEMGDDDITNAIPDFAETQKNVTDNPPPSPDEIFGEDDDLDDL
jgi:hypothetical protein